MTEPNFSAIRARLRYDSVDEFIDGYSRYVTSGGMFIPMTPAKLKPVGTTVRFQFVLGDGATALLGEGVVRQIRGLESEESDSPIGMLVKFTKLSQDSKILIDRIVALKEIEKLGVDIFSDEPFSEETHSESTAQAATTGNYPLVESSNAVGSQFSGGQDDGEGGSDQTGRLEASELAGLGASNFGEDEDDAETSFGNVQQDADASEEPVGVSSSFQEWGPEPGESDNVPVETAGSGELGLDLFGFSTDDFETPESPNLFANEQSSSALSFDFDFESAGSDEVAESVDSEASSSDAISASSDLFSDYSEDLFADAADDLEFPEFSMDESSASSDVAEDVDGLVDEVSDDDDVDASQETSVAGSHVVRETTGGLQILSFDGSADESVDRDFEQFALGSDDDVDSMFDDVFGDAFGGSFGGMDDVADDASQEIGVDAEMQAPAFSEPNEVSEEIDILEASEISEPAASDSSEALQVESESIESELFESEPLDEDVDESVDGVEDQSEQSVAAILFGEESEAFSDDDLVEDDSSEPVSFEQAQDPFEISSEISSEFDLSEIASDQTASSVAEEVFEFEESAFEVDDERGEDDEALVEEMIDEIPEFSQTAVPAPPVSVVSPPPVEASEPGLEEQSENSSELLSLLGALEGDADNDGLSDGGSLSLSHGLSAKSSPVLDDEPDSLSALLASAQKELEARSAVPEEERHRDAIDDLLGDDSELTMPPIPVASPFAVPEVPEKRRKGFMSKLFGKD